MAIEVLMPALSPTMTEGNLTRWLKKEGDKVKSGEVIAEIETDKAIMEVESADSGIIGKLLIPSGTAQVKVNQLIAVLLEEGESLAEAEKLIAKLCSVTPEASALGANDSAVNIFSNIHTSIIAIDKVSDKRDDRICATPLAKKIATNQGVDLINLKGSGPKGRIIKADVINAGDCDTHSNSISQQSKADRKVVLSPMRRVIARRLTEAKQMVPHFYLTLDCNTTSLLSLRQQLNDHFCTLGGVKISLNDIIIKATACALSDAPQVNTSYTEEGIIYYGSVDISVAVAIDDGLITPIIKNADQKSIAIISKEMRSLIRRAKNNQLKPAEFQGGGFSISNLGSYGIKNFNAIINPPQSAILAVGANEERAVVKDGEIKIASMMSLTLSCDHRVIDGVGGAEFLQALKRYIETPALMLLH